MQGGDKLTKNKKTIFLTVGFILLMILIVLFLRNPEKNKSPVPVVKVTPIATAVPVETPTVVADPTAVPKSSLHDNISGLIDMSAKTVSDEVPGLWRGLKKTWGWFTAFDTKHAVILGIVLFFFLSIFMGKKKKS